MGTFTSGYSSIIGILFLGYGCILIPWGFFRMRESLTSYDPGPTFVFWYYSSCSISMPGASSSYTLVADFLGIDGMELILMSGWSLFCDPKGLKGSLIPD